ncbi:MAG: hypothetical protein ACP5RV_12230 [Thiomonas sp.]
MEMSEKGVGFFPEVPREEFALDDEYYEMFIEMFTAQTETSAERTVGEN